MQRVKQILIALPEYYLLFIVLTYWYSTTIKNPVALILTILVVLQIIYKNKTAGLIIGALFVIVNIYMIFALADEVNEFETFNMAAKSMLYTGLLILGFNILMSVLMIRKSLAKKDVEFQDELGI